VSILGVSTLISGVTTVSVTCGVSITGVSITGVS